MDSGNRDEFAVRMLSTLTGGALIAMRDTEIARVLLARAGFGQVGVAGSLRPQNCIYICRR